MQNYFIPLSKKELANIYDISVRTFNNWINEYPALKDELNKYGNIENVKIFSLKQVLIVYKYLGNPTEITDKKPKKESKEQQKDKIRLFNKNEIAKLYKISRYLLNRMIKNVPEIAYLSKKDTQKFDYNEINLIFDYLGDPFLQNN